MALTETQAYVYGVCMHNLSGWRVPLEGGMLDSKTDACFVTRIDVGSVTSRYRNTNGAYRDTSVRIRGVYAQSIRVACTTRRRYVGLATVSSIDSPALYRASNAPHTAEWVGRERT